MITTNINVQEATSNTILSKPVYGKNPIINSTLTVAITYFGRSQAGKIIYGQKVVVCENIDGVNSLIGSAANIVDPIKSASFADTAVNVVLDGDTTSPLRVVVVGQAGEGTIRWDLQIQITEANV